MPRERGLKYIFRRKVEIFFEVSHLSTFLLLCLCLLSFSNRHSFPSFFSAQWANYLAQIPPLPWGPPKPQSRWPSPGPGEAAGLTNMALVGCLVLVYSDLFLADLRSGKSLFPLSISTLFSYSVWELSLPKNSSLLLWVFPSFPFSSALFIPPRNVQWAESS